MPYPELALPGVVAAVIMGLSSGPRETVAIPKRIPPSQRPERKLDDVARAIARDVEEARAAKSAEVERAASDRPKFGRDQQMGPGIGPRKSRGPTPEISTKRPKTGGA